MIILGIETSCDETSAALVEARGFNFHVLSNIVASQIKIHAKYGGVVPEVAARSHITAILPVIQKALDESKVKSRKSKVDLIAVTAGPGLISALSVGLETARYLGYAWGVPVVATNHLAGHLYSSLLNTRGRTSFTRSDLKALKFPALGLIVSGGHTELVFMKAHGNYKLIGETLDDAAGEAFDKIAKLLGLSYPGGPELARLAEKGDPHAYEFPRGMIGSKDFNFSFSGLKTSLLYFLKSQKLVAKSQKLANICASVQAAIVDVLVAKTVSAAKKYRVKTVLLGGGVAANKSLRQKLKTALKKDVSRSTFYVPRLEYCTDNAAMIAAAGYITYKRRGATPLDRLRVDPHLPLR
ncbi:MAG: tRNA (adenosine(37)-N6)-threonylcarbamoyltransferase complex transferase subunit TsaD [bacterium]|nr:tRNA (adenosine(37)-N6)-threonylcarbamoyltransferase complex transferase subunit TsaD [bacterium]